MPDDLPTMPTVPAHVPDHLVTDFDIYNPAPDAERFHAACVEFQQRTPHPLVWSPRHGGHWIAVRGPDVFELYADHARFSSRHYFVPAAPGQVPLGAFTLDPPEHAPFRAFLHLGLSPKAVIAKATFVRQLAIDLTEQLAGRRGCEFIADFGDVLPLTVFLDLVELPIADREHLGRLADAATRDPDPAGRVQAITGIAAYLQPHLAARRGDRGEDLLSRTVNADIAGRPISDTEALGSSIHILGAGLDTVSSLFSFVMLFLARHPEHRTALVKDPELIPAAAMELVRRFPVVTMVRQVREDLDYQGVHLRKGEMVAIPSAFFNLDEAVYERPLEVDWNRRVDKLLTFGNGVHRCPGAVLGRHELVIGLQEWLRRIPDFAVAPGARIPVAGGTVAKILELPLVW
ncbi:MAG: cytochrome P450 [Panacagrimonas sp.]